MEIISKKAQTNLEIKIQVIDDETSETFEKTCDSIQEANDYLAGFEKRERAHAIEFGMN